MEELSEILKKLDTGNTSKENKISNINNNITTENICENCSGKGWITIDLPIDHPNFGNHLYVTVNKLKLTWKEQNDCLNTVT